MIIRALRHLSSVLATVCFLQPFSAHADDELFGGWAVFTTTGPFSAEDAPWRYWLDVQHRKPDFDLRPDQVVVRPAIGYVLNENWSAWLGYAYFRTNATSGRRIDEHRPWQQLAGTLHRTATGTLSTRFRLEQRDLETGSELGWRLRAQLKYVHALNADRDWWAYAFVEPFIGFNDTNWGARSGLQQNRTAVGLGFRIGRSASLEVGYMNQFVNRDGAGNMYNSLLVASLRARVW